VPYQGEWDEKALANWVMAQDVPVFGELSKAGGGGADQRSADLYANKFFSSTLIKFIAFVRPEQAKVCGTKSFGVHYQRQLTLVVPSPLVCGTESFGVYH
jgi:hypothetical protein